MAITYQPDGANGVDSDLTPAVGFNKKALATRLDINNIAHSIPGSAVDEISIAWSTEPNLPDVADWPAGDYIGAISVLGAPAGASYKIQLLRVNAAGVIQETLGTSASMTGTGAKSYTASVDPGAGSDTDRFQMRILGSNSKTSARTITITIDSVDTYMQGPWVSGPQEFIQAKVFPMSYLENGSAAELRSKVSGATVTKVANDMPHSLVKAGKAAELVSKWN